MKKAQPIILILLFVASHSFSQTTAPGQFVISNHGKDFPQIANYEFGKSSILNDQKEIRDNQSKTINGDRSYNGITAVGFYSSADENGIFTKYEPEIDVEHNNGEYRFDWMISDTEIDAQVVQKFINYLDAIPENGFVLMYSGYFHGIDKMNNDFYKAIERFGSKDIRNLKENDVWVFYGSLCNYQTKAIENYASAQDSLISISISMFTECSALGISNPNKNAPTVFPNPFSNTLNIDVQASKDFNVSIVSLTGKEFLKVKNQSIIDVSALPKGVFLVQVKTESKSYTTRVIKN